jgi:hypothetical protein
MSETADKYREFIKLVVDNAPPFDPTQAARLRALFRKNAA